MQIFLVTADLFRLDPRFATKTEIESEGGCWLWTGGQQKSGKKKTKKYGRIWHKGLKKNILVHRWVYSICWGAVPEGCEIHHSCYNELCVNPNHLVALTEEEHKEEHEANYHRGHSGYLAAFSKKKLQQALMRVA